MGAMFVLAIMVLAGLGKALPLIHDNWRTMFAWWTSLPSCDRSPALWSIIALFGLLLVAMGTIFWLGHKAIEFVQTVYLDLDGKAS